MRKITVPLAFAIVAAFVTAAFHAQTRPVSSYADEWAYKGVKNSVW